MRSKLKLNLGNFIIVIKFYSILETCAVCKDCKQRFVFETKTKQRDLRSESHTSLP